MIDIDKAKKSFDKYVKKYNPNDPQIYLKIKHIESVVSVAKEVAESLNLDEENVKLAELIALLHDIGRFEQVKRYHTFMDKDSINHAEFGVNLLKEGLIREFINDDKYDKIILNSVLNHNRNKIDEDLDEHTKLHCRIVRDADKVDIYNVLLSGDVKSIYNGCENMSYQLISDRVYNDFLKGKTINYLNIKTHADVVVSHIAYIYDINFEYSIKIIKENDYINKLINKIDFKNTDTIDKIEKIRFIANEYLKGR